MSRRQRVRQLPPAEWHQAIKPLAARSGRGQFNLEKWIERVRFFGCCCWICGRDLSWVLLSSHGPISDITADHILRRSEGGSDFVSNLRPCCSNCNSTDDRRNSPSLALLFGNPRNLPDVPTDKPDSRRSELLSRPDEAEILRQLNEIGAELKRLERECEEREDEIVAEALANCGRCLVTDDGFWAWDKDGVLVEHIPFPRSVSDDPPR